MNKTKLITLTSLLMVIMLSGCNKKSSSLETISLSQSDSDIHSAIERITTSSSNTVEELHSTVSETSSILDTQSITSNNDDKNEYNNVPDLKLKLEKEETYNGPFEVTLGDFIVSTEKEKQMVIIGANGKTGTEAQPFDFEGISYDFRINHKSGDVSYKFNALKAGKLVLIARSGSDNSYRKISFDNGSKEVMTSSNYQYAKYEFEFDEAGEHLFTITKNGIDSDTNASAHILDMAVYYLND